MRREVRNRGCSALRNPKETQRSGNSSFILLPSNNTPPPPVCRIGAATEAVANYPVPGRGGSFSTIFYKLREIYWCRRRCRHICRRGLVWLPALFDASNVDR